MLEVVGDLVGGVHQVLQLRNETGLAFIPLLALSERLGRARLPDSQSRFHASVAQFGDRDRLAAFLRVAGAVTRDARVLGEELADGGGEAAGAEAVDDPEASLAGEERVVDRPLDLRERRVDPQADEDDLAARRGGLRRGAERSRRARSPAGPGPTWRRASSPRPR